VVHGVLGELEIRGVTIYRVDLQRRLFVSVGSFGVDETLLNGHEQVPLDIPFPISEVYRTGTEYNATIRKLSHDYPMASGWADLHAEQDTIEVTILPVFRGALVIGVVVLGSRGRLGRDWQVRNVLDTMCACLSCWSVMNDPTSTVPLQILAQTLQVTDRQREILQLVEASYSNQQIALRLGFSEGTIRSDLLQLTRLLRVRGRQNLVMLAREAGLLEVRVN
jgi:DNA-binding CsgD family transcriptional regulator